MIAEVDPDRIRQALEYVVGMAWRLLCVAGCSCLVTGQSIVGS